jgi:Spy/CpxP family protein refolding chaperone
MKNYKLIIAIVVGSLIAVSAVNAQDGPRKHKRPDGAPAGEKGPGPRGDHVRARMKEMAEKLGLSEEQKAKLRDFMKEQAGKREELKNASPEDRRAAMKELRGNLDSKMKEILTAEQYSKWVELRPSPENRPSGKEGERRRPEGDKPAKQSKE